MLVSSRRRLLVAWRRAPARPVSFCRSGSKQVCVPSCTRVRRRRASLGNAPVMHRNRHLPPAHSRLRVTRVVHASSSSSSSRELGIHKRYPHRYPLKVSTRGTHARHRCVVVAPASRRRDPLSSPVSLPPVLTPLLLVVAQSCAPSPRFNPHPYPHRHPGPHTTAAGRRAAVCSVRPLYLLTRILTAILTAMP